LLIKSAAKKYFPSWDKNKRNWEVENKISSQANYKITFTLRVMANANAEGWGIQGNKMEGWKVECKKKP